MATCHTTRGYPLKLFKRRSHLNVWTNSFSLKVIDEWNALSANLVLAPAVNNFRSQLNKHWHGHPIKFEAACHQPGDQQKYRDQEEMHFQRPLSKLVS